MPSAHLNFWIVKKFCTVFSAKQILTGGPCSVIHSESFLILGEGNLEGFKSVFVRMYFET